MEKKPLKAIIQLEDRYGNPIGKLVEVYKYEMIRAGEGIFQIKFREGKEGFGTFLLEVVILDGIFLGGKGGKEKIVPLCGIYTTFLNDVIEVVVKGEVEVGYLRFLPSVPMKRKSGERNYQELWPADGDTVKEWRVTL